MSLTDETRRIIELLRDHHNKDNQWATFVELRNGTGSYSTKGIDFFAVHTWPSKGFHSIAYEIKVSRSDFAAELKQPNKRLFAESVANECYFVVPNGLVRPDEIPEGWGLMIANAGGLKKVKYGTQRTDIKWPHSFVMSIVRRVADAPPTLPLAAWKLEGREINEEALIAVAETTLNTKLADEQAKLRAEGKQALIDGDHYQTMVSLQKAVASVVGRNWYPEFVDAEAFEEWIATKLFSGPQVDMVKVRQALALLTEVIKEPTP